MEKQAKTSKQREKERERLPKIETDPQPSSDPRPKFRIWVYREVNLYNNIFIKYEF